MCDCCGLEGKEDDIVFFFSSRRRHTISLCDWSSDLCSSDLVNDPEHWIEAHMKVAEKWHGRLPGVGESPGTWKERARRAEAERDSARVVGNANMLEMEAKAIELERALDSA